MKRSKSKNFLVLWRPHGNAITVDQIKIIDAWSSESMTIYEAQNFAESKAEEYANKHGQGKIEAIPSRPDSFYWIP